MISYQAEFLLWRQIFKCNFYIFKIKPYFYKLDRNGFLMMCTIFFELKAISTFPGKWKVPSSF